MMNQPLLCRHRRASLVCLFALSAFVLTQTTGTQAQADSGETIDDHDRFGASVLMIAPSETTIPPTDTSWVIEHPEQWCGWGTHDSFPNAVCDNELAVEKGVIQAKKNKKVDREVKSDDRGIASDLEAVDHPEVTASLADKEKESGLSKAIATITASVGSRVGVSVQQLVEPFAMVGPDACSTLDEIAALTKYWTAPDTASWKNESPEMKVVEADATADVIDADAIAAAPGELVANDDVDYGIVSFVPFVDFVGQPDSQSEWESPLASAVVFGSHDLVASDDKIAIDWQSHDDAGFDVVSREDVKSMQLDTPALQSPIDLPQREQKASASLAKDALAVETATVSKETRVADSREENAGSHAALPDNVAATSTPRINRRLVGGSAMIVTIDEVILPFDLAIQDPTLRNLFPVQYGTCCILERTELSGLDSDETLSMAVETDIVKNVESARQQGPIAVAGRFDEPACLLDDAIWNLECVLDRKSAFRRSIRAKRIGRQLGKLASTAMQQTADLVSAWPALPHGALASKTDSTPLSEPAAETAGQKLIARAALDPAGQAEAPPAAPITQIDQVHIDQLKDALLSWCRQAESVGQWMHAAHQAKVASAKSSRRR
tara:strand:+ start:22725 stop:24554 length:1830 start_codon:yes stop_codon:yes gene_type:complete